jgi:lipopolysaccharide export system permease protein
MKILQRAASGTISNDVLFTLVGLDALHVLGTVLPPAFFFAILYAIGRMYRQNEMTAMAASGVGMTHIYRSVFYAAIPVSIIVAWLTLSVLPWMNLTKEEILKVEEENTEFTSTIAGRFNEFRQGGLVFYVEEMSEDKSKLRNIFVQNRQHGKLGLITATEGYQYVDEESGDRFIVLQDGHRYEGEPGYNEYSIGQMKKYGMRIAQQQVQKGVVPYRARSTATIMGSSEIGEKSELQHRLLLPVAVLVFALLSVPLCRTMPREGMAVQIGFAILLYVVFINMQAISGNWMKSGVTPVWMGRWWIHFVMLALGGVLLYLKSDQFDLARRQLVARWRR